MARRHEANSEMRLSPVGERRKALIGEELLARSRDRRVGRRVIAGAGGSGAMLLVLVAVVMLWNRPVAPPLQQPTIVTNEKPRETKPSVPEHRDDLRVIIVANQPLPTKPCAAPASQGDVGVCVLDDTQLLRILDQSGGGESHGIVRVGGKTMVVANGLRR